MARLVAIGVTLFTLVSILQMLRSGRLREKYAFLWLTLGIVTLVLALFPALLYAISGWLGFVVPANLLFSVSIVLLGGVAIHLSWELSNLESETRRLSEELALLRAQMADLTGGAEARPTGEGSAPPADRSGDE